MQTARRHDDQPDGIPHASHGREPRGAAYDGRSRLPKTVAARGWVWTAWKTAESGDDHHTRPTLSPSGTTSRARAGCCCRWWSSSSSGPAWSPVPRGLPQRGARFALSDVGLMLGLAAGRLPRRRPRWQCDRPPRRPSDRGVRPRPARSSATWCSRSRRRSRLRASASCMTGISFGLAWPAFAGSSPPWCRATCGSATSGSTSPCSTWASGSAASPAACSSTSSGCGRSRRSTSWTRGSYLAADPAGAGAVAARRRPGRGRNGAARWATSRCCVGRRWRR